MAAENAFRYHLMTVFTVIVWGTTFVSTKILIGYGLTPAEILLYRFLLAYIGIWFISPKVVWAKSWKDELWCVAAGLTGGSLYFVSENSALGYTQASNVSLIISSTPILTALLACRLGKKERLKPHLLWGALLALAGVAFVVFNGSMVLRIGPLGDVLTLSAALMWAFYVLILRRLSASYSVVFMTRKVFFYGILTLLPVFYFTPTNLNASLIVLPQVWGNLLFLGILASLVCYIFWNQAVKQLGAVRTTNYIYFIPLVTLLTSAVVLQERITWLAVLGSGFILSGVYVAEKGLTKLWRNHKLTSMEMKD